MKRVQSLTASAVAILLCLPAVQGAPRQKDLSPPTHAKATFGDIDQLSGAISDRAFELQEMARNMGDPEIQQEGLAVLKDDVNRIGRELQSLEAERDSLSTWEANALDQTIPLMKDIADNTEQAIQTYNSNRLGLFAPSYTGKTDKIDKDAREVTALLHNYLKLADGREKAQRVEQSRGDAGQF
jgi:hypothetical protein